MEKAFFVVQTDQLKIPDDSGYSRLYYGIEFCQHQIPTLEELKTAMAFARDHSLGFTLVTPYVSETGLKRLKVLFDYLREKEPATEIVVNDWGVLHWLRREYPFHNLVLGRIPHKMKRDPRINFYMDKIPQEALLNFQDCSLSVPSVRRFLIELGVKRLEFDNLLQGINMDLLSDPPMMTNSLYYPIGYITTTRLCKAGNLNEKELSVFKVLEACGRTCRNYRTFFKSLAMRDTIVAQGSTFFYKNLQMPSNLKELGIDRIVFEPEIPMMLSPGEGKAVGVPAPW
ncbi:MAG: hypothetical protein PHS17_14010 [Desulfobacterales bacterium]|nr:hypothetical protein [Desulfobacterales bacterium]